MASHTMTARFCLLVATFLVCSAFCLRTRGTTATMLGTLPVGQSLDMYELPSGTHTKVVYERLLGRGANGIVLQVKELSSDGKRFALKFHLQSAAWQHEWQVAQRVRAAEKRLLSQDGDQESGLTNLCLPEAPFMVQGLNLRSTIALRYPVAENGELGTRLDQFMSTHPQSASPQLPAKADASLIARLLAALRIIVQMSAGLSVMHRAGIVHGDIKPENMLVGELLDTEKWWDRDIARQPSDTLLLHPTIMLTDFGLSFAAVIPPAAIPHASIADLQEQYPVQAWNGTFPLQTAAYRPRELWMTRNKQKQLVPAQTDVFAFACTAALIFRTLVDSQTLQTTFSDQQSRFMYRRQFMLIDVWRFGPKSANTQVNSSLGQHFSGHIVQQRMSQEWVAMAEFYEDQQRLAENRQQRPAEKAVREIRRQLLLLLQSCVHDLLSQRPFMSQVHNELTKMEIDALRQKKDAENALKFG